MSWVEKSEKMSEGPHSPHTPADEMNDPINSTLHSLTAPDDLDNHEDLYEDDRRLRVDDEEYRPRRRGYFDYSLRATTSRSQSPRRRSPRRSRSPRRERISPRRSRSPRTPPREPYTDSYRPTGRRPSYNDHYESERERRERELERERHNIREPHRSERERDRRDRSRSRERLIVRNANFRPDRNYGQRLSARESAGKLKPFSSSSSSKNSIQGRISIKRSTSSSLSSSSKHFSQAINASQRSQKECRVYVGNLAYEVKWGQLKDFMRQAGEVVFADVLMQPNGMSKGCGVVEYRTPEEARRAIQTLNDTQLLGRPVFIREDRESEAKFGTGLNIRPEKAAGFPPAGNHHHHHHPNITSNAGRQIYVGNLPFSVGWQELKDLFRAAGNIIRADILVGPDRRPKGSGTVLFETPGDAANAISMYDGYEMNGRRIEVREDRFAGGPPPPRFSARPPRPYGGGSHFPHGGNAGFYGAPPAPSPAYPGSYQSMVPVPDQYDGYGGYNDFGAANAGMMDYAGGFGGGYGAPYPGAAGYDGSAGFYPAPGASGGAAGNQIFVRNLPFTTTNLDLRELFKHCGNVLRAEILEQNGRPKGAGIVSFDSNESARFAVEKFSGYTYGGRVIDVNFDRYAQ